ncbi:LytR/AlgR family response regulator transcription factor [Bombilactobacillus bombi]|uniref:LytR/AlgR family response regulator transcription factor n=1 Tax=Bombilactobacillus bombi TaxID=1303590 RepID=UPI0015E5D0CF|nr:LytTR family DNA-binding domain-containing protein [Bombilactobacillus bombi]MBA1435200.1 response regulator transcription factor [Bombilactobacillus bombi]
MDILICEDNIEQLYELQRVIKQFQIPNLRILMASNKAQELIKIIKSHGYIPGALFILDVNLGHSEINGLELAQYIRQNDVLSSIVFVTTHSEMAYLTFIYKVEALDYILKDQPDVFVDKVEACLQLAMRKQKLTTKQCEKSGSILSFKIGPKFVRIASREFVFAETSPNKHRIIIHANNQQLEIYGSLDEVEKLSTKLIRCHNSYVINQDQLQILDLTSMCVVLKNGVSCPISRKYVTQVKAIL